MQHIRTPQQTASHRHIAPPASTLSEWHHISITAPLSTLSGPWTEQLIQRRLIGPDADQYAPIGMPEVAWHPFADVGGMQQTPAFNGTSNNTRAKLYRRAYDAAVSYQDYNMGKVLRQWMYDSDCDNDRNSDCELRQWL